MPVNGGAQTPANGKAFAGKCWPENLAKTSWGLGLVPLAFYFEWFEEYPHHSADTVDLFGGRQPTFLHVDQEIELVSHGVGQGCRFGNARQFDNAGRCHGFAFWIRKFERVPWGPLGFGRL
jgi:hypothetical protein